MGSPLFMVKPFWDQTVRNNITKITQGKEHTTLKSLIKSIFEHYLVILKERLQNTLP